MLRGFKVKFFAILAVFLLLSSSAFAVNWKFWKKAHDVGKIPETRAEWEKKAKNVDLEDRKKPEYNKPKDKKAKKLHPSKYDFVKYNFPQGTVELNLAKLKHELSITTQGVVSPDFCKMAYSEFYFSSAFNQVSSEIYIKELDTKLPRMRRVLSSSIWTEKRDPVLSSGTKEFKQNLFSSLTIVDWSADGNKLLVKEKLGSSNSGIFKTNLHLYFYDTNKTIKLTKLDTTIQKYWKNNREIILNDLKWDILPLGFNFDNDDEIIVLAYTFEENGKKVFLGAWSYDFLLDSVKLLSLKNTQFNVSTNGLIVKQHF